MPHVIEGLPPFIFADSKILILGSMPSEASLKAGFYYMHPRNRMWMLISKLKGQPLNSLEERKQAARALRLAFFDVIKSCQREGSLDSKIKQAVVNDLPSLCKSYPGITRIICAGSLAYKLLCRNFPQLRAMTEALPSTSPANAAWSLARLAEVYLPSLSADES